MMTTKPLRALALVTVVTAVALSTQALVSEAELAPTTSREDSVEKPGQVNALEAAETDYGTETELVLNEGPLEVGRYFYLKPVSSPGLCVATAGASRTRGVKVQQSTCSTSKEYQRIYFRQVGADNYQLAFQHSAAVSTCGRRLTDIQRSDGARCLRSHVDRSGVGHCVHVDPARHCHTGSISTEVHQQWHVPEIPEHHRWQSIGPGGLCDHRSFPVDHDRCPTSRGV